LEKKKKTYLLLVAVLGLWGTIAYQVLSALSPKEPSVASENISVDFSPKKTKIDTFSITQVKRDPFLGKLSKSPHKATRSKGKTITKKNDADNPWPQIQYQGMVKKQGATSEIFIITINQQQYLLKRNQELENVKLLRGNAKEIVVRFNKEIKTVTVQ